MAQIFMLKLVQNDKMYYHTLTNGTKCTIIINERRDNIEIKIIGADTPEGTKIKKDLKRIAKKQKLDISILEMNDKNNIRKGWDI